MRFVRLFFALFLGVAVIAGCSKQRGSENANDTNNSNTSTNANNTAGTTDPNAANANAPTTASKPDDFMKDAAKGGIMEVQMGQMAAKQGSSADVKKFGQMLVTDHKKANDELMSLAKKKGVVIPAKEAKDKGKSEDEQDMAKLTGTEFDKKFIDEAVKDHEKDVDEFQKQADKGDDADLKAWAAKTLPTLQKHLDQAKSIQAKLNNNDSDASMSKTTSTDTNAKGAGHKH
jgi:putative membrane protein